MGAYIVRRILQTLIVLVALSFVTYWLMGLMPGDPLDIACAANPHCTPETLEQMREVLGLNQPISHRYWTWLKAFVQGDLGYSRTYRRPVQEILWPHLINTLILWGGALVVSLLVAVPLGIMASLKPGGKLDSLVNLFAFVGISMPSFWLGLVLMIVFSVKLGWFPAGGMQTVGADLSGFASVVDRLRYLVLPVLTLSAGTIAQWARFTRSSMVETMRHDFIRTARAKGLAPRDVLIHHGLRNALIPVVTVVAVSIGFVFSGAVITETVFSYSGAGKLIFDSIIGNDFNVAICAFVVSCSGVLVMNLVADLAYAYLDPRITYR